MNNNFEKDYNILLKKILSTCDTYWSADIQNFASIGKEEVYFLTWKSYGQTLIKRALVLLGLVFKKL